MYRIEMLEISPTKMEKYCLLNPYKPRPSACLTPIWLQTDTETQTLSVAPLKISFFRAATFFMRASGSLRVCGSV